VLRFANIGAAAPVFGTFFYSDTDGGKDSLADIGLPTAFNTNTVSLP